MARNLGPDMLAHLEAKRPAMSEHEYTARRIEIERLIREGRAVELTGTDRLVQFTIFIVGVLLGVFLMSGGTTPGFLLGAAAIIGGIVLARRWGRRI